MARPGPRAIRRGLANVQIQACLTAAVINLERLIAAILSLLIGIWTSAHCSPSPLAARRAPTRGYFFNRPGSPV